MLDHQVLLLDTRVAVGIASSITKCCWIPWWPSLVGSSQAIELPRWPVASRARSPSAAAGYPGGRHSCKAEWSWVPIRTFDRSPPMGTVLTVDRLSLLRRCVSELPKALYHFRGGALAFSAIPGYPLPSRCGPVSGPANFAFWRILFFGSLQAPLIA